MSPARSPEQELLAAMMRQSVSDAASGDTAERQEALEWIESLDASVLSMLHLPAYPAQRSSSCC